jgi:hypothetical protein
MFIDTHGIQDFVQPRVLTRERKTGYSPGHIRSVLELDTFGPNNGESVEARRQAGVLPSSPNYNKNFSPSHSRSKEDLWGTDHSSTNNSTTQHSVRFAESKAESISEDEVPVFDEKSMTRGSSRPGGRKMSGGSIGSICSIGSRGSLASQGSSGSIRMRTPSSKKEIMQYEEELFYNTPTSKRLEYANARVVAQKVRYGEMFNYPVRPQFINSLLTI